MPGMRRCRRTESTPSAAHGYPCRGAPPRSSIWAKASRSSAVDTRGLTEMWIQDPDGIQIVKVAHVLKQRQRIVGA